MLANTLNILGFLPNGSKEGEGKKKNEKLNDTYN